MSATAFFDLILMWKRKKLWETTRLSLTFLRHGAERSLWREDISNL